MAVAAEGAIGSGFLASLGRASWPALLAYLSLSGMPADPHEQEKIDAELARERERQRRRQIIDTHSEDIIAGQRAASAACAS